MEIECRDRFEQKASPNYDLTRREDGHYSSRDTEAAWCGWRSCWSDRQSALDIEAFLVELGRPHIRTAFLGDGNPTDDQVAREIGSSLVQIHLGLADEIVDIDSPGLTQQPTDIRLLDPDMPQQELLLHMGEMSAGEIRTARAAIRWANSYAGGQPDRPITEEVRGKAESSLPDLAYRDDNPTSSATEQPDEQPDIGMAISLLQVMRPGVRADAFRDFLLSRGAWGKGGNSAYMHVGPDEIMRLCASCTLKRESGVPSGDKLETYYKGGFHNGYQAAKQGFDWLPMEAAPKDGTEVLLYYENWCNDGRLIISGAWDDSVGIWRHEFGHGDAQAWRPLPDPPDNRRRGS